MRIKGYTLIEVVIVLGLFIAISTIVAGILYSTLRSTNKTKITNSVTQNGNYALSAISDVVTSSDKILAIDGVDFSANDCSAGNTPAGHPNPWGETITLQRMDGGQTTLICDLVNGTIASEGAGLTIDLIDKNQVTPSPTDCKFTCTQADPYSTPQIDVSFTISDRSGGGYDRESSASFKTSVSLRNYNAR